LLGCTCCAGRCWIIYSLPAPQRDALGTAFGLLDGRPPDRFMLGPAVLSLLTEAAGPGLLALDVTETRRALTRAIDKDAATPTSPATRLGR
jgi:hypothetical protein